MRLLDNKLLPTCLKENYSLDALNHSEFIPIADSFILEGFAGKNEKIT